MLDMLVAGLWTEIGGIALALVLAGFGVGLWYGRNS